MAAENIGSLVPTKIPGYVDAADIQAALRLYHYGSYSYNPANTSTAALVNPSIAYTLNDIQDQIDAIGSGGIQPTIFTAKGGLITSTAANTPVQLAVGASNGMVLTVNSATSTGLEWQTPAVTLTNSVTLTNKTLTAPVISTIVNTGTLTLPTSTDTLVGRATTDTLTNKSISLGSNTITGTLAQFNTALTDADFASLATAQTLTNKTISLANNTLTGTIAQFNTALSDGDFATLAGTETLTNKTLTAPRFADLGFIADANGNELIIMDTVTSAINEITIANAAASGTPTITASGSDVDISLNFVPKGSGTIQISGVTAATVENIAELQLLTLMGVIV